MKSQAGPVLVVEDDPNAVLLLDRALHRVGLQIPVVVVRDGDEAVEYLSGRGRFGDRGKFPLPCLILLDLKLPRKSGFEVLEWLRAQPDLEKTSVVVMTSSSHPADRKRAFELRAAAYLVKPIGFTELVAMAKEVRGYVDKILGSAPDEGPFQAPIS